MSFDPLLNDSGRRRAESNRMMKLVERALHFMGYYLLLKRKGTRSIRINGFRLTIHPTVYDPRFYRAPTYFAQFIRTLEISGKVVADLWTGSGIQALTAARAGAAKVIAIDINPKAAASAAENARANGLGDRVSAVASNLFSAIAPGPHFDVILSNPPFCEGEAWDVADRAWHAGAQFRDITAMFKQAHQRLAPGGVVYLILSSQSDLEFLGDFIREAGFRACVAAQRPVLLETLIIYELRPDESENLPSG